MDLYDYITSVEDFPIRGVSFKDITPMTSHPEAFRQSVDQLADAAEEWHFDAIAGFDARGFLWAGPLAYRLALPLVPIRKAGKLPRSTTARSYDGEYGTEKIEVHTSGITPGTAVLLVDDVIATGQSMRAGAQLVKDLGGTVAGCLTVVELTYLGAQDVLRDYPVKSLLTY